MHGEFASFSIAQSLRLESLSLGLYSTGLMRRLRGFLLAWTAKNIFITFPLRYLIANEKALSITHPAPVIRNCLMPFAVCSLRSIYTIFKLDLNFFFFTGIQSYQSLLFRWFSFSTGCKVECEKLEHEPHELNCFMGQSIPRLCQPWSSPGLDRTHNWHSRRYPDSDRTGIRGMLDAVRGLTKGIEQSWAGAVTTQTKIWVWKMQIMETESRLPLT